MDPIIWNTPFLQKVAEVTKKQDEFVLLGALYAASVIIGRKIRIPYYDKTIYGQLYMLGSATTGMGKSTPTGIAKKLLRDVPNLCLSSVAESREGILDDCRRISGTQQVVVDGKAKTENVYAPQAYALIMNEYGEFGDKLISDSRGLIQSMCDFYQCDEPMVISGIKAKERAGVKGQLKIYPVEVSMLGTCTEDQFHSVFKHQKVSNSGFFNRHIIIPLPRTKWKDDTKHDDNREVFAQLGLSLHEDLEGVVYDRHFHEYRGADAMAALHETGQWNMFAEIYEGEDSDEVNRIKRLQEHTYTIAALYMAMNRHVEMTREDMLAAIAITKMDLETKKYLMDKGDSKAPEAPVWLQSSITIQKKIREKLEEKNDQLLRDLRLSIKQKNITSPQISMELAKMEKQGDIEIKDVGSNQKVVRLLDN